MSRGLAILTSSVVTGLALAITFAFTYGLPGMTAQEVAPEDQPATGNEQAPVPVDDATATPDFVPAAASERLSTHNAVFTPSPVAMGTTATGNSGVSAHSEAQQAGLADMQDTLAEVRALNEALLKREDIYRARLVQAIEQLQAIESSSHAAAATPTPSSTATSSRSVLSAPVAPPTAVATATAKASSTAAALSTPIASQQTPVPATAVATPIPVAMTLEIDPGPGIDGRAGTAVQIPGASVKTSRFSFEKGMIVDWGDGSPVENVVVIQDTGEVLGFHVFREPGIYVVQMKALAESVVADNWTYALISAASTPTPMPTATSSPTPSSTATSTAQPTATSTTTPIATATPGPLPPPVAQPTGVTFEDAAYVGRAMTGISSVRSIAIKSEDTYEAFEVNFADAKVFVDTTTGVVLMGENMRTVPVIPPPEPPASMLTFDDAYSIAVTSRSGNVSRISLASNTYSVTVSGVIVRIDAFTGAIK